MITHAERAIASAAVALTPSTAALHSLCGRFREELARALAGRAGSLKMLPTFVQPPRGDERGPALFIDWGGTHGRAGCVALDGAGRVEMLREERFTFGEAARAGPAERAFDAIAAALARVIGPEAAPLGFVYSFPARLERIDRAIALPLTKGWRLRGLEGQDVVGLLVGALGRRGLRQATVTAVCNDTVAAMAALTYRLRGLDRRARPADIGLIVGTGSNQAADLGAEGIRNLESGNFGAVSAVATPWDEAIDRELADPPPGAQRFEKLVAGGYLGEIARRLLIDLAAGSGLFATWTRALHSPFGLDTAALGQIAGDRSPGLSEAGGVLRGLGVESTAGEREALRILAHLVVTRSARLIAAALLGTLEHIDPALDSRHHVAVDGSLYGRYPGYARLVEAGFAELCGAERAGRIRLEFAKDSTALGAAVIAAATADQRPGGG